MFPEMDIKKLIRLAASYDPDKTLKIIDSMVLSIAADEEVYHEAEDTRVRLMQAWQEGQSAYAHRPSKE